MKNKLYFNTSKNDSQIEQKAFESIQKERGAIGYYDLPYQDTTKIKDFVKHFDKNVKNIVIIGIGGSSLGAKAIYEFVKPAKNLIRNLIFLESTDPLNISNNLKNISLDTYHFIVISKSGTTIETMAIFKYIYSIQNNPHSYTFITDPNSKLQKFAEDIGSQYFNIPDNVGGRFSVLSNSGLIPLALVGIDIDSILEGAKKVSNNFFGKKELADTLVKKAVYYAKNHTTYDINCLFAYSEALKYFCEWYMQLWGESLGKRQLNSAFNVGLTPIGLIGPKDQHSFLQLLIDGTRNKSATFIKIDDFRGKLSIPNISLPHLESFNILNNISFHNLINMQCDATLEALMMQDNVPLDEIVIKAIDEHSIGELIFYYQLLVSIVGHLINVNTYNQPSVEMGKLILNYKLNNNKGD